MDDFQAQPLHLQGLESKLVFEVRSRRGLMSTPFVRIPSSVSKQEPCEVISNLVHAPVLDVASPPTFASIFFCVLFTCVSAATAVCARCS